MTRRGVVLLALLAATPAAAHRDTKFPIAATGELQHFPDLYGPASLTLGPSTATVRIGSHEITLPPCILELTVIPPSQRPEAHGSWYHDLSEMPPYLAIEFPQHRSEDGTFEGHTLSFDMEKGALFEVRRFGPLVDGARQAPELDLTQLCDASARKALAPKLLPPLSEFAAAPVERVAGLDALPGPVRALLAAQVPGEISPKGGPFNPSDVLDGKPERRLLDAGRTGALYFVLYEHGGIGHHVHLLLVRSDGGSAELAASLAPRRRAEDLEDFRELARAGALLPASER